MKLLSLMAALVPLLIVVRAMNAQETKPASPDALTVFEARVFDNAGAKLPYRLLKPLEFDASDKNYSQKFPLVLVLHGAGERGNDNALQLVHGARDFAAEEMRRRHGVFVVFPQCPVEKKWVEVPWDGKSHVMPAEPSESIRMVFALVDALQREFPIDRSRIYATGLSMGGFGVWDILQRKPDLLAAAVPICGGGDPAFADGFKATPVWAFHGVDDPTVTPDRSRQMIAALKAAGGRPIYTEYEGVGHDSWTATFANRLVWDWLFAQRSGE